MTKRDIIFLLGAGASVDAGLPAAVKLTENAERDLKLQYPALLSALRYLKGAIQFGKACREESSDNPINIEEILNACSFLSTRGLSYAYPFVGAWHERIQALELLPESIRSSSTTDDTFRFLATYCKHGLLKWLRVDNAASVEYLKPLIEFVDYGFVPRIFTLNYDECMELALQDALGAINTSWTTGFGKEGWDQKLLSSGAFDAYLYKLHGSLDWISDPKLGICSIKWPEADQADELPSDFDPLLIFGVDVKFQPTDPFLTLLYNFRQWLNLAQIIVVIGYGFGDIHINAMLLEALQRSPQMRCIVVNTSKLDDLLPDDSNFRKLLNLEERFIAIPKTTKVALQSGSVLQEVQKIIKHAEEEAPF
jgi:hypothetical protein